MYGEWSISHTVEKLYDREPVVNGVTRQGICSLERSPSVEMS